ncbi:HMG-box [Marasmius fiardii PR-910]|nr:HMG-box [Marasmius fiardii PR-910]
MADVAIETARVNYTKGLQSVIDAMRQCTEYAEIYMAALNDPDSVPHPVNGTLKRKRGKGKDVDEEGGSKRKRVKDPNAPKRPASSYIIFQNDVRQAIKQKNPNHTPAELRTLISQEWAKLKDEDKEYYKKEAEAAKVKYTAQKAAYAARSPEEIAAAAAETAEQSKRGKSTSRKAKSVEKAISRESTVEPEPAPVQPQTSSAAASDESSEESGSSDEEEVEEDEEEEDDDEEEQKPAPKKVKVSEKPVSKQTTKKLK